MELRHLMDLEVPTNGKENQTKNSFTECNVPDGEIKLCERNIDVSSVKSVAVFEPPELIDCMKEVSYNGVKDICIVNKISAENCVVIHDELIICQASSLDVECDTGLDVRLAQPVASEEGALNSRDGIVKDACSKMVVPKNQLLETENSQPEISRANGDGVPQLSVQETSREAGSKISKEVLTTTTEESNQENAAEVCLNGDMGSTTQDTTSRDEDPQSSEAKLLVQSAKTVNPENSWPSLESRAVSSRMFTAHGYGETSFSMSDPPSSLVTYSGHLPYSGSISLRSDSSTTSTRSFAFPILNSEWTSSPVKMAKADRRHFRKHQRWKLSLLCCRF